MAGLTIQAALAIAMHCVPPSVAPIMVGIAQHESGLNPDAINHNSNGTIDVGISQINSRNFGWLGLTMKSALDPCKSFAAGARVLFVKYNGSPPPEVANAYAAGVTAGIVKVSKAFPQDFPVAAPVMSDEARQNTTTETGVSPIQRQSNPFSRPVVTGRDVVFLNRKDH